jgi:hypothetical protein
VKIPRIIKGISFFALLAFLAETNLYAQWQILSKVPTSSTNVVYFLDNENKPLVGFAGGSGLSRTTDRGLTWTKVSGAGMVTDITFKDATTGFFSTYTNVFTTADGGVTWRICYTSVGSYFSGIYYNKKYGRLFLSDVYKNSMVSTNDGVTWNPFAGIAHNGFAFMDDDHGISSTYNSNFLFTVDGGLTWNTNGETREAWQPIALPDVPQYLALCELSGDLIRSYDGSSWQKMSTRYQTIGTLRGSSSALFYRSKDYGFYLSTDLGNTWNSICGPTGFADSRFYVHNDSIYAGSNSDIWFNPNPTVPPPATVRFMIDTFIGTRQCVWNTDTLKLRVHYFCQPITIISATITNNPTFIINPAIAFPRTPSTVDTVIDSLVLYEPRGSGADSAILDIRYTIPADLGVIVHDTLITIKGFSDAHDTIADRIVPKAEAFRAEVCKSLDSTIKIYSGCGDFDLISASLRDTSVVGFTLLTPIPTTIHESGGTLAFHIFPKVEDQTYTTYLILKFQRGSFIKIDSIPLIFQLINFEENFFKGYAYRLTNSCASIDTLFSLTNPNCDSITITSISFQDPIHPFFTLPKAPFTLNAGETRNYNVSIAANILGSFSNPIIVKYRLFGHSYTVSIPVTLTVLYNQNPFAGMSFTLNHPCQVLDTLFTLVNPLCDSMLVTSLSFQDSLGFLFDLPQTPFVVEPKLSRSFPIFLKAKLKGTYSNTLIVTFLYNGVSDTTTIPISVLVNNQTFKLETSSAAVVFGTVNTCKKKIKSFFIGNSYCNDVTVTKIRLVSVSSDFTILNPPSTPFDLPPGTRDSLFIQYAPTTSGNGIATLQISVLYNGVSYDTLINVSGAASASEIFSTNPSQLRFDTVSTCISETRSVSLINDNCDSVLISEFDPLSGVSFVQTNPTFPIWLHADDSLEVTFIFSPRSGGNALDSVTFLGKTKSGNSQYITLVLSGLGKQGPGLLSYSPHEFIFAGTICDHDTLNGMIVNIGCDSVQFYPSQLISDPDFHISAPGAKVLAPHDSLIYTVYLEPAQKGLRSGYIIFTSSVSRDSVPLTITVTDGTRILSASPDVIDLGTVPLCEYKDTSVLLSLRNTGCDTLTISNIHHSGSGFGSTTIYPVILLPGQTKQLSFTTTADTAGGKVVSIDSMSFESNADNMLTPVILKRAYSPSGKLRLVGFYLDSLPKAGNSNTTVSFELKETPTQPFAGADVRQVSFDLKYNTDLLTFDQALSSANVSFDGQHFLVSGNPISATNGILGSIGFRIYLTKDSVTTMSLSLLNFTSGTTTAPCSMLSVAGNGSSIFNYSFVCGERSIQKVMNGDFPLKITGLHPNPAQEQIDVELESREQVACSPTVYDALGAKVYSVDAIINGKQTLHIDTREFPSGVYLLRIGNASQSFIKTR